MRILHSRVLLLLLAAAVPAAPAGPGRAGDAASPDPVARRARAFLLFVQAREEAAAGKPGRARELLEQVLELDPGAASAHAVLARTCLQAGDPACAETEARRALELAPGTAAGHRVLAEIEMDRWRRTRDEEALERTLEHLARATEADPLDASAWGARIRILASRDRLEEAERVAREASAVPGLDPAAPFMALARALLARGRVDRAVALLRRAEVPGPAARPILETLADLEGERGELAAQEEVLERLRELEPESPDVCHRLGMVRLARGDDTGAIEPLEAAHRLRPGDPGFRRDLAWALVRVGRGAEALPLLEDLPAAYRSHRTLLAWVHAAEQAGRYDLAAERIAELEGRLDDDERETFGLALALQRARDLRAAGRPEDALAALPDRPDDPVVTALRCRFLVGLGRAAEAREIVAGHRRADPDRAAWIALEALLSGWETAPGEERDVDRAVSVALAGVHAAGPEAPHRAAEVATWLLGWQAAPLAARLLDAFGLPPDPPEDLLRVRAAALMSMGRTGEAEAVYRMLLARKPDDAGTLNDLGYLLADAGRDLEEALGMVRRAVDESPDNPNYLDSLAWTLHRLGRSAEALPLLLRALRGQAGLPDSVIREHLGDVYLAVGDVERALAEWRAALALGSERKEELERKIRRWEGDEPGEAR